jgi:ubiquinone/menaquinone biosynthesis C-methylase UbiE
MTPAELYEEYFGAAIFVPWAKVLLEVAAPRADERALDLACGTGIVSRQLVPRLGPSGALVALDLRPGMLAVARTRAVPAAPTICWLRGNALALPFRDRVFDLVLCQQGLQFFSDRPRALRQMRRVIVDGGRVVAAIWQSLERQPVFRELVEAEARHLAPLGVTFADAAAAFMLGDPNELRALFGEAGFSRVEIAAHTLEARFPDADAFVPSSELAYAAIMPEYFADPAAFQTFVEAVARDVRPHLQRYRQGEELVFPQHAHLVVARA